ncbi:DUF305 domain-containing protein [Actinoplanes sp. NPDC004185]
MSIALRAVAGSSLLALLLGAGACGSGTSTTAAPPVASSSAAGFFGGTDLAWVEITIAMNEELLPLLDLAPAHASDPGLKALAAEVKSVHEQELSTLRGLHDEARLPAENPHKGMPMPGMVTPDQVAQAAATQGAAFDKLLAQHLEAHLEQGVKLAESEGKAGLEPRTKDLAARVLAGRRQFLAQLPVTRSSGK